LTALDQRIGTLERVLLVTQAHADRARVLGQESVQQTETAQASGVAAELAAVEEERRQLATTMQRRLEAAEEEPASPRHPYPMWDRTAGESEAQAGRVIDVGDPDPDMVLGSSLQIPARGSRRHGTHPRTAGVASPAKWGTPLIHLLPLATCAFMFLFFSAFAEKTPQLEHARENVLLQRAIAADSILQQIASAEAARQATLAARPVRVLVADDSPTTRCYLVNAFGATAGLDVVGEAVNGLEAMLMTMTLKPDVVVMDLEMPIMDGFEATNAIMTSGVPTPIVAVSSNMDVYSTEVAARALQAGAVAVLEKPAGASGLPSEPSTRRFVEMIASMGKLKVGGRDKLLGAVEQPA
jgi:CheY-like chemotaxis protein